MSYKSVTPFKDWVNSLSGLRRYFFSSLKNLLEDKAGGRLYLEKSKADPLYSISRETARIIGKLKELGFIDSIRVKKCLPDDPKAIVVIAQHGYLAKSKKVKMKTFTGNDFFNADRAAISALGEAVERTCLARGNANDVKGLEIVSGEEIKISSKKIYLSQGGDSTGAAAHTDKEAAIINASLELIEREALASYLENKISPEIFSFENSEDEEIKKILKMFRRKNIEFYALNLKTEASLHVIASLLIDRTGIGPAVVISGKADFDAKSALLGSAAEAVKSWQARRRLKSRGLRREWFDVSAIPKIEFFFTGNKIEYKHDAMQFNKVEKKKKIIEYFRNRNQRLVCFDITIPEARSAGFSAVKCLIL